MTMSTPTLVPKWFEYLGAPANSQDFTWCFSNQKQLHAMSLISRRPVVIVPGLDGSPPVLSFDPPYIAFQRALVDELDASLPVDVDEAGYVGESGIHTTFERAKTVSGYSMGQMSLAPTDNAAFCHELGLPDDFKTPRHSEIFDAFMDRIFSHWKLSSVKTAKLSTAGAPLWVSNARYKRDHALFLLANRTRVLDTWRTKPLDELAAYAKVVFLMNAGRRDQVDSVGKTRLVFPLDYALSGGTRGEPVAADKRVVIEGREYPDFSATRARLFHGAPYAANLYPQIIATGCMHAMFERYPETFHCTDVVALADAIGVDEKVACSDASEYDRSIRTFLIKRMFERARMFWDPVVIDWCEHLAFASYFSRPVSLREGTPEAQPNLVGNVFEKEHQLFRGNPSGHAWTSLIAKVMMVFDFLATTDDLMHDVLERMDDYLRHKMPLKTHNNGDDGMYRGPIAILNKYAAYRFGKRNPGYFVLTPEVGHVWSGYIMAPRPEGGYTAFHRATTTIEKLFCPERSAGGNFRPRFTIGMLQRLNYGDHPRHDVLVECIAKTWRAVAEPVYGNLMERIMAHHERLQLDMNALTPIDRIVLDDPTKLYHQYTESDVSPEVLAMIFEKALTTEEVEPFAADFFYGDILQPNA